MANVRIKDLTNTASSTASDDFLGVDGATNGTRKLSAYSPTFGGNLTVSGTGTNSFTGQIATSVNAGTATDTTSFIAKNATLNAYSFYASGASADQKYWAIQTGSAIGDGVFRIRAPNDALSNGINALTFTRTGISSVAATIGGNLTVSGTIDANGTSLAVKSTDGALVTKVQSVLSALLGVIGTESNHDLGIYTNNTNRINVSAAGIVSVSGTTDSATKDTGCLVLEGGLGVEKAIYAGGVTNATGGVRIENSGGSFVRQILRNNYGATDEKSWRFTVDNNGTFVFDALTDAETGASAVLTFVRLGGGAGVTEVQFNQNKDHIFSGPVVANRASNAFRITTAQTPASAGATGTAGTICWDTSYVYVCTATNTWKRAAISTW